MLWVIIAAVYVTCGLGCILYEREALRRAGIACGVVIFLISPLIVLIQLCCVCLHSAGYVAARTRAVFRAGYRAGER